MKRRKFFKNTLIHCYQRTAQGGVLFYTYSDHLVYFTQYCTTARKYGIQVLSLCQMPDHIHDSVKAPGKEQLEAFKRETNAGFSRKQNTLCGLEGAVFESPFGYAPKFEDKSVRTNLIYLGNNPVERKLVKRAELYRWNYLAYALSDHPFSEKLAVRDARWPLQKAVREIVTLRKAEKPLNYAQLNRLFAPLDGKERQQLTDFIIVTYNVIDHAAAIRCFGSYDDMLMAMHSTTGSEYDLGEVFVGRSDAYYTGMSRILLREAVVRDIHDILSLSTDEKFELFQFLQRRTDAPSAQIAKFLRMPFEKR